jgi:very-short-patch-repair endonuclease
MAKNLTAVPSPKGGSQNVEQAEYDAERTKSFESQGYKVICFWNNDVMNVINGIIRNIQFALEEEYKALR